MTGAAPQAPRLRTTRIRLVGAAILAACAIALAFDVARFSPWQAAWFDALQRIHPRTADRLPVTIVEIDEKSIASLGRWPWPRKRLARLLHEINGYAPSAIGLDLVMPDPDPLSPDRVLMDIDAEAMLRQSVVSLPSNDRELESALRVTPSVLAIVGSKTPTAQPFHAAPILVRDAHGDAVSATRAESRLDRYPDVLTSLPLLDNAAHGWGLISVDDPQAVLRRYPLVADVHGTLVPSLALEMWRVAQGARVLRLATSNGVVDAVQAGNDRWSTDADGKVRTYFSPRNDDRFVSAADVLEQTVDMARIAHAFVLVGVTALAVGDDAWTPLGIKMPGSEVHAQILENMVQDAFLVRPRAAPFVEAIALLVAGAFLIVLVARGSERDIVLAATCAVAILVFASYAAFRAERLLFDGATPSLMLALLLMTLTGLMLADATRYRQALQRVLQQEREAAARVAGELEAARRIQLDTLPRAGTVRDPRISLAATMEPALEVGGDLYDFYLLDSDRLFFMLGDVAGKGLSASIFMAVSKALCKSTFLRSPEADLGALLGQANREVSRDNPAALFVTVFAGVLDLESGVLGYCNAGHEHPWLCRAADGHVTRLAGSAGPPLCVVDDFAYRAARVQLTRGDIVCVVSDGVTEANDATGALYGASRVTDALATVASADEAIARVMGDVKRFVAGAKQSDDISVLALRWTSNQAL